MVLKTAKLEGDRLTFDVEVIEGDLTGGDGRASLFINRFGFGGSHASFRRVGYGNRPYVARDAWYRGPAIGAAAIGADAVGAAAAAPYFGGPPAHHRGPIADSKKLQVCQKGKRESGLMVYQSRGDRLAEHNAGKVIGSVGVPISAIVPGAPCAKTIAPDGDAWNYFPHDHARSRAYRWNEDGIGGFCDEKQNSAWQSRCGTRRIRS